MKSFNFTVDKEKCTRCKKCIGVCSSVIIHMGDDGYPIMDPSKDGIVGWDGCYRCQRCMAVCPKGAISILDKNPVDSVSPASSTNFSQLDALMRNRRACRSYLDKEVPRKTIDEMLTLLENVPTGSNKQNLFFNIVYKKAEMDKFRKAVRSRALELAEEGIYPGNFSKDDFEKQLLWETVRNPGDMFFVNAPHILVIHSKKDIGQWKVDPVIAATWFDLICASKGIGAIIMTYPVGALAKMPELESLLQIPQDHHYSIIIGFGYPKEKFARGVQREGIIERKELTFDL